MFSITTVVLACRTFPRAVARRLASALSVALIATGIPLGVLATATTASATGTPTGIAIDFAANHTATLSWAVPAPTGGADPTWSVTSSPVVTPPSSCTNTPNNYCDFTGLTNGTTYTFTITNNATGDSATSSVTEAASIPLVTIGGSAGNTADRTYGDGTYIWTTQETGVVTEYNESTGAQVWQLNDPTHLQGATSIALVGSTLYVPCYNKNYVAKISTSGTYLSNIPVGTTPLDIVRDANYLWVANSGSNSVSKISISTGAIVATISNIPRPRGLYDDGNYVYATSETANYVSMIPVTATSSTTATQINVGHFTYVITSDGGNIFVRNDAVATAWEFPADVLSPAVTTVNLPSLGGYGAVTSDGRNLWTLLSSSISQTDTSTNTLVNSFAQSTSSTYTMYANGANVYLGDNGGPFVKLPGGAATVPSTPFLNVDTSVAGQATLSWTPPAASGGATLTGFNVQESVGGGYYNAITSGGCSGLSASSSTCTITGLTTGVTYSFRIDAVNTVGAGSYFAASAEATATAPTAPQGVSATLASNSSATVSWSAPSSNGGSPLTGYVVKYSTNNTSWTSVTSGTCASVTNATSSCTATGLPSGSNVYFEVAAVNVIGTGTFSASFLLPSIRINNMPTSATPGFSFVPTFTTTSPGATSVTSSTTSVCTVSGGRVNVTTAGTCTLTAAVAASGSAPAGSGSAQSFTVSAITSLNTGLEEQGVALDGTHVWVDDFNNNGTATVTEYNESTGAVVRSIPVTLGPIGICDDGTHVWVTSVIDGSGNSGNNGVVTEINTSDGSVVGTITVQKYPMACSTDGTHVWVSNRNSNSVTEIDAATATVVRTIAVGNQPWSVYADGTHVWVPNYGDSNVSELNASDGSLVRTISLSQGQVGITGDANYVWTSGGSKVMQISKASGSVVSTLSVSGSYVGITDDGSFVWSSNYGSNSVTKIDAQTGVVLSTIALPGSGANAQPWQAASDGTHVYVTMPYLPGLDILTIGGSSAPAAPQTVSAAPVSGSSATVSWSAPSFSGGSAVTGYVVRYSTDNATWTTVTGGTCGSISASTTSCTATGLTGGANVYLQVAAINAIGTGSFSASSSINLLVSPSTPSITNVPSSATYGGTYTATVSQATGDGAASVTSNTTSVCTVSNPRTVTFIAAGTCSLTAQTAASSTYSALSGSAQTFTVSPAVVTVTAPSSSVAYGTTTVGSPTYSGFVNGDTAASLTTVPTCASGTTSATPAGSSGTSTCSGGVAANYTFQYVSGVTTVSQATLTITAPTQSIVYGATASTTPTYSGFVGSDSASSLTSTPTCTSGTTNSSVPGTYTSVCWGASSSSYQIVYVSGVTTVTSPVLTITSSNPTMSFGATPPVITYTFSGFVNGDDASVLSTLPTCTTTATNASAPGSYTTSCSGAQVSNYTIAYVSGSLTVNQATPTAPTIATPSSVVYGHTFTPVVTKVGTGVATVSSNSPSVCTVDAGTGVVTLLKANANCVLVTSVAASTNYAASTNNGQSFWVSPAPLTVTASSASLAYGATAPIITASYSGFLGGDTSSNGAISVMPYCTAYVTSTSSPGSYVSSCAGGSAPNYQLTFVNGSITVTKGAAPTVSVSNLPTSATAGNSFTPVSSPSTGVTIAATTPSVCSVTNGTVNYVGVGSCVLTVSVAATATTNAGSTTLTGFTVTQGQSTTPTISNLPSSVSYGSTFTPSVSAVGDGATTVTSSTSGVCVVNGGTGLVTFLTIGTCTLVAHIATTANFVGATGVAQSFSVTKAVLTVTASNGTMVYNTTLPTITPSFSGFVNGENTQVLNAFPVCASTVKVYASAGTYPTACANAVATNYSFVYVPGTVTITPATPTVPSITNPMTMDTYDNVYTPAISTTGDGVAMVSSSTPSVCLVVPTTGQVVYVGVGTCTLTPTLAAGANYAAAANGTPMSYTVAYANTAAAVTYGTWDWWGNGYNSSLTLTDNTLLNVGTPDVPWSFTFVVPTGSTVSNLWGATYTSTPTADGSLITVTALSDSPYLTPGQSVTIGFTTTGPGAISSFTMGGVTSLTSPSAPTTVVATQSSGSATVTWSTPSTWGSGSGVSYVVSVVGASWNTCTLKGAGLATNTCTFTNLTNGTAYSFVVRAINSAGVSSSLSTASASVTPVGAPDAPTITNVVVSGSTAVVVLSAPFNTGGAALTSFTVTAHATGTTPAPCVTATLRCTFTGLSNGASYTFTVTATNAAALTSVASAASSAVTINLTPNAPDSVWTFISGGAVHVAWSVPSFTGGSALVSYTVTASPSVTTPAACVAVTTTTCVFTGLTLGTAYTFTVKATNLGGYTSTASAASGAVTQFAAPGVVTIGAVTTASQSASVSWTAPSALGGSTIAGYYVSASPGGNDCYTSTTTCVITGLTNGTAYTFSVTTITAAGYASTVSTTSTATPLRAANAPTSVQASAGNAQITVTWTAPHYNGGTAITGYTVTAHTSGTAPAPCTTTTTSCTFTGLTNGTVYTFTVTATNGAGASAASSASNAATPAVLTQNASLHFLFVKDFTWPTGYQGHYTLINSTVNTVGSKSTPWTFSFKLAAGTTIGNVWNASYATTVSAGVTTVTVTGPSYAPSLAPGSSVAVYFNVVGSKSPSTCVAGGSSCVA